MARKFAFLFLSLEHPISNFILQLELAKRNKPCINNPVNNRKETDAIAVEIVTLRQHRPFCAEVDHSQLSGVLIPNGKDMRKNPPKKDKTTKPDKIHLSPPETALIQSKPLKSLGVEKAPDSGAPVCANPSPSPCALPRGFGELISSTS